MIEYHYTAKRAYRMRMLDALVARSKDTEPDPRRQRFWFGPTSSSRRDRNSLRIASVRLL